MENITIQKMPIGVTKKSPLGDLGVGKAAELARANKELA